jgi:polysaccharide biosynthesis protein PslH
LRTIDSETRAWQRADMCGAVTPDDLAIMRELVGSKAHLVPDGFDHLGPADITKMTRMEQRSGTVVFVANFAYQPNIDAALNLGDKIWPLITRRVPDAHLLLVGNAPPPEVEVLARQSANVKVTGRVPEVGPYLDRAQVVVCPLRIGGGIKVKVLEALSRGKAIVTTTIGAQGIPEAERCMRVVDEPSSFARATIALLRRPDLRADLEARARVAANQLPTWDQAAAALGSCYEELHLISAQRPLRAEETSAWRAPWIPA